MDGRSIRAPDAVRWPQLLLHTHQLFMGCPPDAATRLACSCWACSSLLVREEPRSWCRHTWLPTSAQGAINPVVQLKVAGAVRVSCEGDVPWGVHVCSEHDGFIAGVLPLPAVLVMLASIDHCLKQLCNGSQNFTAFLCGQWAPWQEVWLHINNNQCLFVVGPAICCC
jgi:hypothetical protein